MPEWSRNDDLDARIAWVEQFGSLEDSLAVAREAEERVVAALAGLDQAEMRLREYIEGDGDEPSERTVELLGRVKELRRAVSDVLRESSRSIGDEHA